MFVAAFRSLDQASSDLSEFLVALHRLFEHCYVRSGTRGACSQVTVNFHQVNATQACRASDLDKVLFDLLRLIRER